MADTYREHNQGGQDSPYEKFHLSQAQHAAATREADSSRSGLLSADLAGNLEYVDVPLSSSDPGEDGQRAVDSDYLYFYVGGYTPRVPTGAASPIADGGGIGDGLAGGIFNCHHRVQGGETLGRRFAGQEGRATGWGFLLCNSVNFRPISGAKTTTVICTVLSGWKISFSLGEGGVRKTISNL